MSSRYIIARGELLTRKIEGPRKKHSPKARPYELRDAQDVLIPQIEASTREIDALPPDACPQDVAVVKLALHPTFIAKSHFPTGLLRDVGLAPVGSITQRLKPRREQRVRAAEESDTSVIFVAGNRARFRALSAYARALDAGSQEARDFAEIEFFEPMRAADRVRPLPETPGHVFEVGLHLLPGLEAEEIRGEFAQFASSRGYTVNAEFEFTPGSLLFLPVEGDANDLESLAQFTLIRVIRAMPRLRGARPLSRGASTDASFELPSEPPLSIEPRVGILDGGMPTDHVLGEYVRRSFVSDAAAVPVPDFLEHGLGVTSAFLFGPIAPGKVAQTPYSYANHHRILDASSQTEDPYELYRTLGHIENILGARMYEFINLSLGPELEVDDRDVHAWTAVIDEHLSDGHALLTVAVGNNGANKRSRIQVPADSVNALCVGASNSQGSQWAAADYSAKGPGRSPGLVKPDVVAFGGCSQEYFHHVAPGKRVGLVANRGTSFAAPYALRSAVGVRAILGQEVHPLTIKALLVHACKSPRRGASRNSVGWGCIPQDLADIVTCPDGMARIIYQGVLLPGKFLRALVPLPKAPLDGEVKLTATFCYASPVDPQDAAAYTKAGLLVTFRPNEDEREEKAQNADTGTFFTAKRYRTEREARMDAGKWETVLHASHTFKDGRKLKGPVFDIHYNAREGGAVSTARGERPIQYALVVTVEAHQHAELYQDILKAHAQLQAIEPKIQVPVSV